jgi:hypothetical protein
MNFTNPLKTKFRSIDLYDQLCHQLRTQLDTKLRSQLYWQLEDELYKQLRTQLVWQLNDQLYDELNGKKTNA